MIKSLHMFLNKKLCRIQIFFGLCLAMLFTLICSDYDVFAQGHSYSTWGSYNGNTPVQEISGNFDISLTSMIEQSIYNSVFNSSDLTSYNVSYSSLVSSLEYYGLSTLISNWQAGNPAYFLNISYHYLNSSNRGYFLYFSKSNGNGSYNLSVTENNAININNPEPLFFSNTLSYYIQDYSILSTSNNVNSDYAKSYVLQYSYSNSGSNVINTLTSNGVNLSCAYSWYSNYTELLSRFTSFLNSSNIYTFCVFISDYSNGASEHVSYISNGSFLTTNGTLFPLFSTIQSYDYFSSDVSSSYVSYSPLYCCMLYLNRFSTGIILQDTSDVLSYGYIYGGAHANVTPTPIPTFAWTSPTPFPNVTFIPATLTPIVVPYDPYIIGSDDTWDNLAGYLGILNTALKSPVNRFFSDIMQVTYSFSDWFKFILVVPIICLFAFIIGRLKRK